MHTKPRLDRPLQSTTLVVGIDVGKDIFEARAVSHDRRRSARLQFGCHLGGFEALKEYCESQMRSSGALDYVVGMEPTGHYGDPLAHWLLDQGVRVVSVSPLKTARAKELYDGTTRKTDEKDAKVIAGLCRAGLGVEWRRSKGAYADLRPLVRRREQLVKERTRELSRLLRVLDVLFPELRTLFSDLSSPSARWLLERAPTPEAVLAMGVAVLAEGLRKVSRGQLGLERAQAIIEAARRTVAVGEGAGAHGFALEQHLEQLALIRSQIKRVEQRMDADLSKVPYRDRLLSIPGIGPVTAATLVGELGDIAGYRHARQLLKVAGLDLVERSSGSRQGAHRISKRGRPYLRQMLYMAALRGGGSLQARRDRLVGRGVRKKKAAVANMCALLRIVFAVVRDDVDFDPAHGEVPAADH